MVGMPRGGMLGECGIRGGVQLHTKEGFLVRWDAGWTTGGTLRGKIARGATQPQPAFHPSHAHVKDTDGIGTRHTGLEG
jgi:hypothetical protein